MKRFTFLGSMSITLLIGFFIGAVIQRNIGLGSLLYRVGLPSFTRSAEPTPTVSYAEVPAKYQGKMSLFILAGQSNMVGYAPLPEYQEQDSMIYLFGNDYRWRVAVEPVDDATGQVDNTSADRSAAFGPSLAFASAVKSQHPDMMIGLIPCAKSSSAIIEWQRDLSDQSLYGSCLKRARAASPMGHFAGVLFFQGETDTVDANRYPQFKPSPTQWSALFSAFVKDIRSDLQEPDLPVIFAQIGANTNPEEVPYWEIVQEQQRSINLTMTAMIVTEDLPLLDGLHFTADSYRVIGKRFADAYLELLK